MKIDHLTLSFRNKIILEDIDIEIKPGEFVFFIWYSWSGKTSLIRAIIWDFKPERWDVILDNNVALYKLFREDMLLNYKNLHNTLVLFWRYYSKAWDDDFSKSKDPEFCKNLKNILDKVK